jgi:hypothetical protein
MLVISAIKNKDGKIFIGKRHCHCFASGAEKRGVQGFLTDDCTFLNREEAKAYAISIGQVVESDMISYDLTSEDLW